MKRKWLAIGIILLFVGVAVAPSISANIRKPESEIQSDTNALKETVSRFVQALPPKEEFEKFKGDKTYLLVLQRKLVTLFENDDTLNSIVERTTKNDCGCNDGSMSFEWNFPITCLLLFPIFIPIFQVWLYSQVHGWDYGNLLFHWINLIGKTLHCPWFFGLVYDFPPLVCITVDNLLLGVWAIWFLTIGSLNLLLHLLFPNLNITIELGLNLIYFLVDVGLKLNCPGF